MIKLLFSLDPVFLPSPAGSVDSALPLAAESQLDGHRLESTASETHFLFVHSAGQSAADTPVATKEQQCKL